MTARPLALVVGTRPEAIKVAPVALAASAHGALVPHVIATGQHEALATDALAAFGVVADHRIAIGSRPGGAQADLFGSLLPALDAEIARVAPAAVVVQGDTASALAGALVATWRQVPLIHLEAGLRSFDKANPFPEETYRRAIAAMADLHLPPTPAAAANLLAESIPASSILCTGNTVIDAALAMAATARDRGGPRPPGSQGRRLLLVTVHRRENWGRPLTSILAAITDIVARVPDVEVVLPVHPNPIVREPVLAALGHLDRVRVVEPLDYPAFIDHLAAATLVLSDSGGVQEEAPAFGVPVLVLRETTERPEAIAAGSAALVGTARLAVASRAIELLTHEPERRAMARVSNPFGDGASARRVVDAAWWLVGGGPPPDPWTPDQVATAAVGATLVGSRD